MQSSEGKEERQSQVSLDFVPETDELYLYLYLTCGRGDGKELCVR